MSHDPTDAQWMDEALAQATQSLGQTAPNPAVGAVIVREGVVLGRGRTQPIGGPHAEVRALQDARDQGHHDLAGTTLYVTLEPCCHVGRTGPCTDAIIKAGIDRVVVGIVDPYPAVMGKGIARLKQAGLQVELGVCAEQAAMVVRGFTRSVSHGLPEVTCKVACSLDGHLATHTGESKWITGGEARADGHQLRAEHDAIVVGIGTVLADDPRLNCRDADGSDPVPIILDSQLRTPSNAAVLRGDVRPLIICADDAPKRAIAADVLRVPRTAAGVDVEAALRALAKRGLHRVLVEGGGSVLRSFIDQQLVDTLHVYMAPVLIPGGRGWLGGAALNSLASAARLGPPLQILQLGDDVRLTYRTPHRLGDP
ncbi:MAG: bifunctional diaminohydroxyphosphoribosylaminopyrimidine deaminase/5-amino-6-(5-phosphoribosylamino)uracil reductase RibD [Myxococcota bacterium]